MLFTCCLADVTLLTSTLEIQQFPLATVSRAFIALFNEKTTVIKACVFRPSH